MQRKLKLIRKILEYTERELRDDPIPVPEFDDYNDLHVQEHLELCSEAGFLILGLPTRYEGKNYYSSIHRLTWAGHDQLDRLRKEGCGR